VLVGDGLAIASALEDESYPLDELIYDLANLDAGFRFAGDENRWAGRRKIKLSELLGELWSLPPPGSIPRLAIDDAFRSAGVDVPRAIVSTPAIQVHTHLLANGRFLTMLPESVIHFSAKPVSVKMLPVDFSIKLNPITMITFKNRTCSPIVQLFMDCAREVVKPLAKAQMAQRH